MDLHKNKNKNKNTFLEFKLPQLGIPSFKARRLICLLLLSTPFPTIPLLAGLIVASHSLVIPLDDLRLIFPIMSRVSSGSDVREPEDISKYPVCFIRSVLTLGSVAIFHCSFHPTRGNIIDWSMKASEGVHKALYLSALVLTLEPDLKLEGVEFSTLPSGLHQVDDDVV